MTAPRLKYIAFEKLRPWEGNPRDESDFDVAELDELADTLLAQDQISSLTVRPAADLEDVFEIIAGERRYRGFDRLIKRGEKTPADTLACIVRPLTDTAALEITIVENKQRKNLHDLDEAEAFARLEADGIGAPAIGEIIGKGRRYVEQRLALRERLAKPAKDAFRAGKINFKTARILGQLCAKGRQQAVCKQIAEGAFGYRTPEQLSASLREDSICLADAIFDPFDYPGEVAVDPTHPFAAEAEQVLEARALSDKEDAFAVLEAAVARDRELFVDMQKAAIESKRAELADRWAWVEVHFPDSKPGFREFEYGRSKAKTKAGAVIEIDNDWSVRIFEGLLTPAQVKEAERGARAKARKDAGEPAEEGALVTLPTGAGFKIAAEAKVDALREDMLAAGPDLAMIVVCLSLLQHYEGDGLALRQNTHYVRKQWSPATRAVLARHSKALGGLELDHEKYNSPARSDLDDPVKLLRRLIDLEASALHEVFAALVAETVYMIPREASAPGDEKIPVALAAELGTKVNDPERGLRRYALEAGFMAACRRPLTARIAHESGAAAAAGYEADSQPSLLRWLSKGKVKEIAAAVTDRPETVGDYLPPIFEFGDNAHHAKRALWEYPAGAPAVDGAAEGEETNSAEAEAAEKDSATSPAPADEGPAADAEEAS